MTLVTGAGAANAEPAGPAPSIACTRAGVDDYLLNLAVPA